MARVRPTTGEEGREDTKAGLPARPLSPPRARPRAAGAARPRREPPPGPSPQVRQVLGLAVLAGCAFVVLALASYAPTDPSLSVATAGPVANWGGAFGAIVADAGLQVLGWASWAVLGVAAFVVLRLAGRAVGGWGSAVVAAVAVVASAAAVELGFGAEGRPFPAGGLVGLAVVDALVPRVGQAGAVIAVGTTLSAALTLLFGINWQPLFARAVGGVESGAPALARAVGSAGAGALRASARLSGAGVQAVRDRLAAAETDEEDEEEEEEEAIEDEAPAPAAEAAPMLPVPVRPAPPARAAERPPARAPERAEPPSLPDPGSVWSARPAPPPADIDRDAPTVHGARSLVEVEWEETADRPSRSAPAAPARAAAPPPPERPSRGFDRPSSPAARPLPAAMGAPVSPAAARGQPAAALAASLALPDGDVLRTDPHLDAFAAGDLRAPVRAPEPAPVRAPVRPPEPAPDRGPARTAAAAPPVDDDEDDVPEDDDDPADTFDQAPPVPRRVGRVGMAADPAVVPTNLRSGGRTDDGRAVRPPSSPFALPPLSLLDEHPAIVAGADEGRLHDLARRLTAKLLDFGVEGRVSAIRPGPVITSFEYEPAPGVKLSKIASLSDDLAMALKAMSVRIVAPIPGRGVVGIEIPNESRVTVWARDLFGAPDYRESRHVLPVILGKDTEGRPYVSDLAKMPHLLVGGTTGSGKSVGINTMLCSLLFQKTPDELRLILVDPKMLEFELYQDIPHLLHPVVTEAKLASAVLKWACTEMDERYRLLARWQTRNIEGYNQKVEHELQDWTPEKARRYAPKDWPEGDLLPVPKKLPYIVVVIDELADLMMVAARDVEESIVRIAQKARACGIHLIVATQRPSVDVITGLIKANMPSRLAYQVRSKVDGRTILDQNGAETLLGKGDLLFLPPGTSGLLRIHGPFLSDEEVRRVAEFLKAQGAPEYAPRVTLSEGGDDDEDLAEEMDENYDRAVAFAVEKGRISTSMIQRLLKIGYNRAARIMEIMEREGVVGPADGAKPREVLVQQ